MRFSSLVVIVAVACLLLAVFIVAPIGSVLFQSLVADVPLPSHQMRTLVRDAIALLPPQEQERFMRDSASQLSDTQIMETTAATLTELGREVPWDRSASYAEQIARSRTAVERLDPRQQEQFAQEYRLQVIITNKRISLAFMVKDKLTREKFELLRSGHTKALSLEHYRQLVRDSRYFKATLHSLLLAIITCFVTVSLAFVLAFAINRRHVPAPGILRMVVLAPLVSPPIIMAFAAILLFGRQGLVTHGLLDRALGWINSEQTNIYGLGGVVVAMVLSFLPHAYIIMDDILRRHDGRLEEAAAAHGATNFEVFRHVTLPLSRPGIVRAALVVFILSMTDFGNPLVIGRGYSVLSGIVYDEIIGFQNTSLSSALCVWSIIPALAAFFLFEFVGGRKRFATRDSAVAGMIPELDASAVTRFFLTALTLMVCFVICLFYGVIIMGSFTRIWGMDFGLTLDHYRLFSKLNGGVAADYGIPLIWNSVRIAGLAALAGGIFSIIIAYITERVRFVGSRVLYFVAMLPAVVPGVIMGVGYLVAFNQPFGLNALALTGTGAILVLNILFANLYLGVMAGRATLQRIDPFIDEAATALGATAMQRFGKVILPILRHVYLLATLYIFTHGMMTLSAVIFLVSPGFKLASVGIFLNAEGGRYGLACSVTVAALAVVVLVMSAIAWSERRWNLKLRVSPRYTQRFTKGGLTDGS